jgi:hypothetical protein
MDIWAIRLPVVIHSILSRLSPHVKEEPIHNISIRI